MNASRFRVLVAKELSEQARSYRLLATLAVFAFFGLGSPLTAKLTPEIVRMVGAGQGISFTLPAPTAADAVAQFVKNLSQIVLLVLVFLASGAVVTEKEKGTFPFLLAKPVSRASVILAKLLGLWLPAILGVALSACCCLLYTEVLFGMIDAYAFLRASLLLLAHMLTFVTTTLFFSAVSRSQALAGVLSFLSWVLLASLGMLGRFSDFLPGRLVSVALMPAGAASSWEPLAGSAVIVAASVIGAVLAARRWEP
jgi:ABC-2 type transport system permease protein